MDMQSVVPFSLWHCLGVLDVLGPTNLVTDSTNMELKCSIAELLLMLVSLHFGFLVTLV